MSIEELFIQKAIIDKNYIRFSHEKKAYNQVKPFAIKNGILQCDKGEFTIKALKKITVLKEQF